MTGFRYTLEPGEPSGLAAVSQVLAEARKLIGSPTVRSVAKASGVTSATVRALLIWHEVAGDDPEFSYERGMKLLPDSGTVKDRRLRAVSHRLRRPQLATLEKVAAGMGCKDPAAVARLAASRAPHVITEPRLSDAS